MTDGVPSEADYRSAKDGWLTKAQRCLNGSRSLKSRWSDSFARISDGIPPPGESVDIEPERIFADRRSRLRRAEHNRDGTHEALPFDGRAGFEDPFFPANLEGIFGCAYNLGHYDR